MALRGWVRLRVNIAGVGGEDSGGQKEETILVPVATRAVADDIVQRVLPGLDLGALSWTTAPERSRRRSPIQWANLGVAWDGSVFATRAVVGSPGAPSLMPAPSRSDSLRDPGSAPSISRASTSARHPARSRSPACTSMRWPRERSPTSSRPVPSRSIRAGPFAGRQETTATTPVRDVAQPDAAISAPIAVAKASASLSLVSQEHIHRTSPVP